MFQNWCLEHGYERAAELIDENWEQMVSFYRFPRAHWRHLRTSNVIESPLAALRLRTDAAKRFKKVANATAVVWKMLLLAERKFRRINSPELLPAVAAGQQYHGIQWREAQESVAQANLSSVAWGGDRFVAVGDDGVIVHSEDGDRWLPAGDTGASTALYGVAWSGERFVAVGGDTLLHSSDGDRWLPAGSLAGGHSGGLHDVTWSGGRFVAVGDYAVLYSSDGDRWQPAHLDIESPLTGVGGSGTGFVAVGWGGTVLHSSDGIGWDAATEVGDGVPLPALDGVAWSGERFVAVGGWTDTIVHSLDGEHWQEASHRDDFCGLGGVTWDSDGLALTTVRSGPQQCDDPYF